MVRKLLSLALLLSASATSALAGPITTGTWYSFMWNPDVEGSLAGIVSYPGNPPWTLTTVATTYLTVVDAYMAGDRFEVFNNSVSLGQTNLVPNAPGDCAGGNLPLPCLSDTARSRGVFVLPAGSHSITVSITVNPFGSGAAFFAVLTSNPLAPTIELPITPSVPEPSTYGLMAAALAGTLLRLRRQRS